MSEKSPLTSLQQVVDNYGTPDDVIVTDVMRANEMDGVVLKEKITTIFFGHIVDQDLRDTMDRINELDGVVIVAFDLKLNGEEKSTALINIEADIGKKQAIFNRIAEIAEEKDLLVINEV